jgi:hypothetical protein
MARLTVQADVDLYNADIIADGQEPMQVGDVIFFLTDRTSLGNIFNKSAWPAARKGATIWIEGGPTAYGSIDIGSQTLLTVASDASNPNRVQFFNGRGVIERTSQSLAARELQIYNCNYLILDFETNTYPGFRDGWGSGRGGTFGVFVTNGFKSQSSMAVRVENTLGTFKRLEIRGCELSMGSFAKIRASFNANELESVILERNLITRSVGGEGFYVGSTEATNDPAWPIHRNMIVRDNLVVCTAAEACQLQQCGNGTRIHNNIFYVAAQDYRDAFQGFQDTGVQITMVEGDVQYYNNILWGFGTTGLHLFGNDASATEAEIEADPDVQNVVFGTGIPMIYNNAFLGGKKGHSIRFDSSFVLADKCVLRDNDIVNAARNYDDVGALATYHIDMDQSTTPVKIIGGNVVNDGYSILTGSTSNTQYYNVTRGATDVPQFVNSGFDYIAPEKITKWSETFTLGIYSTSSSTSVDPSTLVDGGTVTLTVGSGLSFAPGHKLKIYNSSTKFFYASVNTYSGTTLSLNTISNRNGTGASTSWSVDRRIPYTTTEFVWLAENGMSLDYNLYKCKVAHDSYLDTRPDLDETNWELVYWDEAGKSMYDPLWNGNYYTTDFMEVAGDFRLVKGSYHHLLGRGLSCNEQREDQTKLGWQWKETENGVIRDIPGAYNISLTISDYSYLRPGRYYRFWVERMKSDWTFDARKYGEWQTVV